MHCLILVAAILSTGGNLGLDRYSGDNRSACPAAQFSSDSIEPVLMPRMPSEATSRLRSYHPLLDGLVSLARPIREKLRDLSFWNLRPEYRGGDLCISWEFEFSL